jgi:hypothetical protein
MKELTRKQASGVFSVVVLLLLGVFILIPDPLLAQFEAFLEAH